MSRPVPPVGRCQGCGYDRALSAHRSRRDGLKRLLCTPCWSAATLTEERGEAVTWVPGRTEEAAPVEGGLW
ncbi:hypothetical protein [Streptomyces murinus]|uniref:hypothetical protein n=1 Tax=Streptomyces murinus TaxID=33900 RepID=UPI0018F47E36|nr:hypothetical protein [Streptomyces murinus]